MKKNVEWVRWGGCLVTSAFGVLSILRRNPVAFCITIIGGVFTVSAWLLNSYVTKSKIQSVAIPLKKCMDSAVSLNEQIDSRGEDYLQEIDKKLTAAITNCQRVRAAIASVD